MPVSWAVGWSVTPSRRVCGKKQWQEASNFTRCYTIAGHDAQDSGAGRSREENVRQLAISILSTLLTLTAYAGTIVSIGGGTPDGGPSVVGYDEVDATSWSSINSYRNVGISALLWTGVLGQTPVSYTAYLTNQIGSGTTPANVIATSDVGVSGLPTTNYFGYDAVTVNFFRAEEHTSEL